MGGQRSLLMGMVWVWVQIQRKMLGFASHMSMRAHDQCTSSTLLGGKGIAGPSSLNTMLEGLTEYVNARWM
jgi:hypothetical protein